MSWVLELLVSWVLRVRLKGFLDRFTSANLNLALAQGILHLTDFSLLPEAFASLGVPLTVKAARIQKLEVLLPWRCSPPGPLVLRLQGVRLVVCSLAEETQHEELQKWLQRLKQKELVRASESSPAAAVEAAAAAASGASGGGNCGYRGGGGGGSGSGSGASASSATAASTSAMPFDASQLQAVLDALLRDLQVVARTGRPIPNATPNPEPDAPLSGAP